MLAEPVTEAPAADTPRPSPRNNVRLALVDGAAAGLATVTGSAIREFTQSHVLSLVALALPLVMTTALPSNKPHPLGQRHRFAVHEESR